MIGRLATNDVPALIVGERGTGKELVVPTIHDNSARRDRPFVTLDCADAAADALEAELARPRAARSTWRRSTRCRAPLQARLARCCATSRRAPGRARRAPARVIASTDRTWPRPSTTGAFSRELYEMLGVITLRPPAAARAARGHPAAGARTSSSGSTSELNRGDHGVDDEVMRRLVGACLARQRRRARERPQARVHRDARRRDHAATTSARACRQAAARPPGRRVRAGARRAHAPCRSGWSRRGRDARRRVYHDIVGIVETALVKRGADDHQRQPGEGVGAARRQPRDAAEEGRPVRRPRRPVAWIRVP